MPIKQAPPPRMPNIVLKSPIGARNPKIKGTFDQATKPIHLDPFANDLWCNSTPRGEGCGSALSPRQTTELALGS